MHQGWGTRDASRYNRALIGRGMNQHRQGDSSVHYDETGRVVYQGRRRPDDTLPEPHRDNRRQHSQRRDDHRPREPSYRDRRREPSYRDHNRSPMDPYARGGRPAQSDYSRGGRQYDNGGYRPEPQQQVRGGGGGGGYAGKDYYEDRGYSEYTEETRDNAGGDRIGARFIGIAFIGLGILLLGLGVVEVMLCLEHEYYCLFWTGALVFEFGMFTFIHNGDYHKTWKNVLVLTLGLLAGVAVHVSVALVMSPLAREFLAAGRASNTTEYEALWHMISFQTNTSNVDISNSTQPWVCIGIDGSSMFVLMVSFLTLTAAAVMANRIYRYMDEEDDDEYIFGLCRPKLFNPYGQLSAAQALSFVGIVTVYGTLGTDWNDYWAPVWTAGLVGIAAITNVAALKREELLHLSGIALVFQVLSVCGCVATVVLSTMGLVDDVKALDKTEYSAGFDRNHIIASGCLFALVDVVALVNSFFGVGLTVRLFDNLYRSSPADGEKRPYSDASSYDDDPSPARDQRHLTPHTNTQGYDQRWEDKRGARY